MAKGGLYSSKYQLFSVEIDWVTDIRLCGMGPCHIQEVISQHLFGISTTFFQYSKAHNYNLLSDHHIVK